MEEAKYSFNIRFNLSGYDCQFTVRSADEPGIATLQKASVILAELEKLGAVGERRWESFRNGGNGNGKEGGTEAKPQPKTPSSMGAKRGRPSTPSQGLARPDLAGKTGALQSLDEIPCLVCGAVGEVELIGFNRSGVYRQASKCQACGKWQPES